MLICYHQSFRTLDLQYKSDADLWAISQRTPDLEFLLKNFINPRRSWLRERGAIIKSTTDSSSTIKSSAAYDTSKLVHIDHIRQHFMAWDWWQSSHFTLRNKTNELISMGNQSQSWQQKQQNNIDLLIPSQRKLSFNCLFEGKLSL